MRHWLSIRLMKYIFLLWNRLILKSPKIYITVSFVLIFEKCSAIVSLKPWVGGDK